tara:strand:+ start:46 stop:258 length:213 start_codon:yes stop_codon:yes gene_type:complete
MTNRQGNSVGVAGMLLLVIIITILLSSCGSTKLTSAEKMRRANIDKEINDLWTEYNYKVDSLTIEYYKKD